MLQHKSTCRLVDLPEELLCIIVSHLEKRDFLHLRSVYNRRIRDGTRHAFEKWLFTEKICTTTDAGIAHLSHIACSPFAYRVQKLDFQFRFVRRIPRVRYGQEEPMYFRRLDADLDLGRINDMLVGILKRLPNLKHVGIRAPREITGLEGMDPVFSWQDLYGAFPRSCGLNRPSYIFRWNEVNHQAPCMKFRGILKAIDTVQPKLDCFEITGFSNTVWQSFFAPPVQVAKGMSLMATLRNVTTLVLEFSLHNFEADTAVPARALRHVISTIRGNANLQNLTLSLAPHTDPVFLDPGWAAEIWRPVLKFLATSSPFRLRSLELRGITAATAHTLDDVIRTHSATLRRLVLDTASFRAPNSLHAFFSSLAHSNVEFLSLREIALNGYLMLEMRIVSMRPLQYDDGLDWEQGGDMDLCKDESYRDWIEITLDNSGDLGTMTWDYEGKRYIEGAMMEAMTQVVRMVEDGTIEEV